MHTYTHTHMNCSTLYQHQSIRTETGRKKKSFTNSSNNIKYLRINPNKDLHDLYIEDLNK